MLGRTPDQAERHRLRDDGLMRASPSYDVFVLCLNGEIYVCPDYALTDNLYVLHGQCRGGKVFLHKPLQKKRPFVRE